MPDSSNKHFTFNVIYFHDISVKYELEHYNNCRLWVERSGGLEQEADRDNYPIKSLFKTTTVR